MGVICTNLANELGYHLVQFTEIFDGGFIGFIVILSPPNDHVIMAI